MVKLLRISSENNGTFQADLDAEINIKESASIALQNLTFETLDFTAFRVNGSNEEVGFNFGKLFGANQTAKLTANLQNKNYTISNINDFYKDLEATLNRCLGVARDADEKGQAYATFEVFSYIPGQFVGVENPTIMYKLTPPILLFNFNDTGDPRANDGFQLFQRSRIDGDPTLTVTLIGDSIDMGNLNQPNTGTDMATYSNYIYNNGPNFEWSKGSSMFMARIHNLVDNTGAADTNGFSIGLSFTELQTATSGGQDDIPNTARDFEIRIKRPTDPIEFLTPTNPYVNQVSAPPLQPLNFLAANPQISNDHILIEKKQGQVIGSIINNSVAGGLKVVIFTYTLTAEEMGKSLYPYIAVFGGELNATVGRPMVTINPIIKPFDDDLQLNNKYYAVTGMKQSLFDAGNAYSSLTDFDNVLPQIENKIFDEDPAFPNYPENYNPQLTLNGEVLRVLSFDANTYAGNKDYIIQSPMTLLSINDQDEGRAFLQFDLVSEGLSNLVNSDNYMVILDSNPLFSYDASKFDYTDPDNANFKKYSNKGRRKNILATIPINDNSGIVEYEPNELTFIDFDNRFPQSLKNIKLRVLDKDFNEIRTKGESILTLLIKD